MKRFYADDSAATSVKVGYRQASYKRKTPQKCGVFFRLRAFRLRVSSARFVRVFRPRVFHPRMCGGPPAFPVLS